MMIALAGRRIDAPTPGRSAFLLRMWKKAKRFLFVL
jgi:hypothetical protein